MQKADAPWRAAAGRYTSGTQGLCERGSAKLRISQQTIHRILVGDALVTPDMVVRLGTFCGNGPDLWFRMHQAYDLWHAEQRLADEIAKIPTAPAAA